MIRMSVVYVEYMRDIYSQLPWHWELDKTIMDVPYNEIILNFSGIRSMIFEFAKEYLSGKNKCKKAVNEVNLSLKLRQVMDKALRYSSSI